MSEQECSEQKSLGQIAYETYAQSLGWKSGVTGAPLPEWVSEKVTPEIKAGWQASAEAVLATKTPCTNAQAA